MSCAVPGCQLEPELNALRVRADPERTTEFMRDKPIGLFVLAQLCPTHHGEFEKLGWLVPEPNEE